MMLRSMLIQEAKHCKSPFFPRVINRASPPPEPLLCTMHLHTLIESLTQNNKQTVCHS